MVAVSGYSQITQDCFGIIGAYLTFWEKDSIMSLPTSLMELRGAAYGVLIEDSRALIIQRNALERAYPNKWELPGGKLESGEDYLAGLVREFLEEARLDVSPLRLLRKYKFTHPYIGVPVPKEVHLVERKSGDVSLSEHTKHAWVTVEEAAGYDLVENILDDIKAGFCAIPKACVKAA